MSRNIRKGRAWKDNREPSIDGKLGVIPCIRETEVPVEPGNLEPSGVPENIAGQLR